MTKTLIGFSVLPIIFLILVLNKFDFKSYWKQLLCGFAVGLAIVLPWYLYNFFTQTNFLNHHFLEIGLRINLNKNSDPVKLDLAQNFLYLQSGIGIWLKISLLGIASSVISLIYFWKNRQVRNNLLVLGFWFLILFLPLILSARLQIWHLIPVYAPLFILSVYSIVVLIRAIGNKLKPSDQFFATINMILILCFFCLTIRQLWQMRKIIYPKKCDISNEAAISIKSRNYDSQINMKSWFLPTLVYYSEKNVIPFMYNKNSGEIMANYLSMDTDKLFLVNQSDLEELDSKQIKYKILENSGEYYLISSK